MMSTLEDSMSPLHQAQLCIKDLGLRSCIACSVRKTTGELVWHLEKLLLTQIEAILANVRLDEVTLVSFHS